MATLFFLFCFLFQPDLCKKLGGSDMSGYFSASAWGKILHPVCLKWQSITALVHEARNENVTISLNISLSVCLRYQWLTLVLPILGNWRDTAWRSRMPLEPSILYLPLPSQQFVYSYYVSSSFALFKNRFFVFFSNCSWTLL